MELIAEISFIRYAYENYQSSRTMHSNHRQLAGIPKSGDERHRVLCGRHGTLRQSGSKERDLVNKAFQTTECLNMSIQLFIASSILEIYYSQNMEKGYVKFLENDCAYFIDKCEKRMLAAFSVLKHRVTDFKAKLPIQKELDDKEALEKKDLTNRLTASITASFLKTERHCNLPLRLSIR